MPDATKLKIDIRVDDLKMKEVFRISGREFSGMPAVVVTLSDGTHAGIGEASGVYYLDDDIKNMLAGIELVRPAIENGISRSQLQQLLPPGGARNALDCALWDLEAKQQGKPVWELAGQSKPKPLITTFTVGADEPAAMAAAADLYSDAKAIKVKLTGDALLDSERVIAVRSARPECWMMVDANQGYNSASLDQVMPALVEANVSLVEQPIARGQEAQLASYDSTIPFAADESVLSSSDLPSIACVFQYINIKLDKCGGLTEAFVMAKAARSMGLKLMVGNMLGSSWSAAPAFLLGQQCDVVDLDGPTFLTGDRKVCVEYANGRIVCANDVWGFGSQS